MFVDWSGYIIVAVKYEDDDKKIISTVDARFYAGNNNLYIGRQSLKREELIKVIEEWSPLKLKCYLIDDDKDTAKKQEGFFESINIPVLGLNDISILTVDGKKYIKNDNTTNARDSLC